MRKLPCTIIGCGGLGSHFATAVTRMSITGYPVEPLTLIDGDVFQPHNIANQYSFHRSPDRKKVDDLARSLRQIRPDISIYTLPRMIEEPETGHVQGVVVIAVDSMTSRKVIMESSVFGNGAVKCVIELRMDSNTGISHYFDPRNTLHRQCWGLHWHRDDEARNTVACGGHHSVISAVYGTVALGLRQLEHYLEFDSPLGGPNRLYHDFARYEVNCTVWPHT